jgi:excinuclease ABC subunit C
MMAEVLRRRLAKLPEAGVAAEARQSFDKRPDLILLDGGKGQLSAVRKVLKELGLEQLQTAALAKRLEEVYRPGKPEPIVLPRGSEALYLLQRIRDEAHRYAVEYHRALRGKSVRASELDSIPGVGEVRKRKLLSHYGSIKRIAGAGREELEGLKFLDRRAAGNVYEHFRSKGVDRDDDTAGV